MQSRTIAPRILAALAGCIVGVGVLAVTGTLTPATGADLESPQPPTPIGADTTPVLAPDTLFTAPINGIENTKATKETVSVSGQPFDKALKVTLAERPSGAETNATQLMAPNTAPVSAGDAMVATLYLRGAAVKQGPAQVVVMFEKATDPWTKSIIQPVTGAKDLTAWKRVVIPFTAAESYQAGEAMLSIRLATQAQTVELAGLTVLNYGKSKSKDELLDRIAQLDPIGTVTVAVDMAKTRQTMEAFGGNFCQGRFGRSEPNDAVGRYTLENLNVRHARIGIPLQFWQDGPGQPYKDDGPNHGTFLLMQEMKKRRIPMVASAWDAPRWMLSNPDRDNQRIIPRERWKDCIEALGQWLVTARDKYGVTVDYLSFNEADGGFQIKFTSAEIADFIKQAHPRFKALNLNVKWLAGDTANGRGLVRYTRPLLMDKELAPYLGPISFHSWDALDASPQDYAAIAALGKEFNKPIWCLEMGHDAQLWRASPPVWNTWDNGLRLAQAYVRTILFSEATVLDYWEYTNDYPLVDGEKDQPYPAFFAIQQMERALPPGSQIVEVRESSTDSLITLAAKKVGKSGFSVLLLNNRGPGEVTLTGLPVGATVALFRTSRSEQNKPLPEGYKVNPGGSVTIPITARSLTTVAGTP